LIARGVSLLECRWQVDFWPAHFGGRNFLVADRRKDDEFA
jgi:hypothetical protein